MTGVEVASLVKMWGDTRAVDDVGFSVSAGSLAVLLGPSGCGKSTTLRIVAGLDGPDSGTVTIGGRDVAGLVGTARSVSMVFQSYALFPHLTVAENVTFGLSVRRVPRREIKARLDRIVGLLELGAFLERKPGQLSGGQQQRVALGRALIAETPVCLLDEPLSNLDAKLRLDLRREIRALQRRLGITMIYVTHDQTEAMSMADQVILMNRGRIEQNAPPREIHEQPASLFVARFVGGAAMNLLPLADDPSGRRAVIAGQGTMVLDRPGQGLVLGLRPEDVSLTPGSAGQGGTGLGIPAVVDDVEYLGADAIVTCRVGERSLAARVRGSEAVAPGMAVRLGWRAGALHVFESGSGRRLEGVGDGLHPITDLTSQQVQVQHVKRDVSP